MISSLSTRLTTATPPAPAPALVLSPADRLRVSFTRQDVLALDGAGLARLMAAAPGKGEEEEDEEEEEGEGEDKDEENKGDRGRRKKKKDKKKKKKKKNGTEEPLLVTLLFTLNELYTAAGVGPTTAFLRRLSAAACPGTLLLVVDSPGSYSEAAVGRGGGAGGEKRRYPMQWLLDHTLLRQDPPGLGRGRGREENGARRREKGTVQEEGKEEEEEEQKDPPPVRSNNGDDDGDHDDTEAGEGAPVMAWEKLESADSVWFRLADGLRYPIQLENMRYQMHLYRAYRPQT